MAFFITSKETLRQPSRGRSRDLRVYVGLGAAKRLCTESSQRLKLSTLSSNTGHLASLSHPFLVHRACPLLLLPHPFSSPLLYTPTLFAKKHPSALVRPVTTIQSQRMSSTPVTGVPSATLNGPPKLEKKPVKFSNLLRKFGSSRVCESLLILLSVGAGLNMFE